jgi:tRNA A-37 threonylcarbamoyl transferase component Bud32
MTITRSAKSALKSCPECFTEFEDSVDVCPTDSTKLQTVSKDPLVGTMLDERYLIEGVIGRGGMGVVYRARQQNMDKDMAIKMLYSHKVSEPEAIKRFHREAKTVTAVRHHHIINLYDFGMYQNQPYLVMDYLEGKSLKDILKDEGALSFERAGKVFEQVLDALASAHESGVVHRDLKPENIMLSKQNNQEDWVTLVDFGLSKIMETGDGGMDHLNITKVGDVCGSPPYMCPEQCLSSTVVDPRSDLYSLGIVIYESLSLKLPFNAKSAIEMLDCHLYATPIPFNFSIPEMKVCSEMTRVLNTALEKDPEKRYQNAQEFLEKLQEAVKRDGVKHRAMKHREEVAQFHGLMEEAKAIRDSEHKRTSDEMERLAAETIAAAEADASGIAPDPQALAQAVEGALEELEGECPYCGAAVTTALKFCASCQRQLLGSEPKGLGQSRTRPGAHRPLHKTTEHSVGFSSRAKEQMGNNMGGLSTMQKALSVLLIFVVFYGCYAVFTNDDVMKSINRVVASIQSKSEPEEAPAPPKTAPGAKSSSSKK